MGRRNRECYLCGEKYSYCPTCSQDKNKPSWMSEFHSEGCKNIFQICTEFNLNLKTKSEAKAALEQYDLSNKEKFKSYIKRDLENIFAIDETSVKVEEPKLKRGKRAEFAVDEMASYEVVEAE